MSDKQKKSFSVASLQKLIIFYPLVQARSSILRLKYVFCFSSARLGNKQYLAYHPASQSARAKNTIHLCAIYSGSSPPAKSPLAFWTWNPGLNSTSPRLIDISDPNCPLFQRKPLLCLLLPSPPLSKCCPTLSTYRACGTKCWREFNIFWSGYFAFVLFIIVVIIIINIIIIIVIIIIIIIILLKLISAVVI